MTRSATTRTTSTQHDASTPDKVADAIIQGVLRRRYAIGQRLVEMDLTQTLGVSRGTVREALKQLEARGVVRLSRHRGAEIRSLSRREAGQLLQVLEVLCGLAARLCAAAIDKPDHRRRFSRAAEALLGADVERERHVVLEERGRFYQTMLDLAGNAELDRAMPVAQVQLFRTQFHDLLSPRDVREMAREYAGICDAILAGDERLAETRMARHIRNSAGRVLALTDAAFSVDSA